jgi:hypothetical protein
MQYLGQKLKQGQPTLRNKNNKNDSKNDVFILQLYCNTIAQMPAKSGRGDAPGNHRACLSHMCTTRQDRMTVHPGIT